MLLIFENMTKNEITTGMTLSEYSQMVGIPEEVLIGKKKSGTLPVAREVHWLHLLNAGYNYNQIARLYDRSHASIIDGIKTAKNLIETKDASIIPFLEIVGYFSHQEKKD
jgi:hypothetical protein